MGQKKHILIVEDDLSIYPVLTRMVRRLNPDASVDFFDSAEAALISMEETGRTYSAILSDINLAGYKSGIEFTSECYFNSAPIPCVLTSSQPCADSVLPFLAKPYRYEEFFKRLAPHLHENAPDECTGKIEIDLPMNEIIAKYLTLSSAA
jgi:DNA-binding NtrC family response regulator